MELHHIMLVAVAAANLAVTIWLLRLLIPMWRTLKKVMSSVDQFDFDKLASQFLNGEPMAESIHIKTTENKEEGYKEIVVTRTYKKPLDAKEVREGIVRQMAQEMQ
jgi:hypothetical protein